MSRYITNSGRPLNWARAVRIHNYVLLFIWFCYCYGYTLASMWVTTLTNQAWPGYYLWYVRCVLNVNRYRTPCMIGWGGIHYDFKLTFWIFYFYFWLIFLVCYSCLLSCYSPFLSSLLIPSYSKWRYFTISSLVLATHFEPPQTSVLKKLFLFA